MSWGGAGLTAGGGEKPPPLPLCRAGDIEAPAAGEAPWLVDQLWLRQGVGILGGPPKSCKSWLALDLAVSVASGTPALGRLALHERGPALLFAAEDAPPFVRERLESICRQRGLELESLDIFVILASTLRLESQADQERLAAAVRQTRPRLLVLDPFIRLHRIDENRANEVAGVLGYLRDLQREHALAVLVVHHARKAAGPEGGVDLRGSSDFRAWSDSNLYLRRFRRSDCGPGTDGDLTLAVEHRSAPAPPSLALRLVLDPTPHLELLGTAPQAGAPRPGGDPTRTGDPLASQVIAALAESAEALSKDEIRDHVRARNSRVLATLDTLVQEGKVERAGRRWKLVTLHGGALDR